MTGLETSLDDLKYNADKALIFGLLKFAVPMVLCTGAMLAIGYGFLASVLVASCSPNRRNVFTFRSCSRSDRPESSPSSNDDSLFSALASEN